MPRTFYDGSSVGFFPRTFPVHKLRRGELQFLPGSFLKNVFHKLSLQISERVQKDRPAFFFDMQLPLRKFLRDGRNLTSVAQNIISLYRKLQSEKTVFFRLIPGLFRKISLIDLFRHRAGKKHTRFNKRNLIIALSLLHTKLRQLLSFYPFLSKSQTPLKEPSFCNSSSLFVVGDFIYKACLLGLISYCLYPSFFLNFLLSFLLSFSPCPLFSCFFFSFFRFTHHSKRGKGL